MMQRSSEPVPAPGGCRIAAYALVESPLSELQPLRGRPAPTGAPPLPPRFLRHADEQTVVGLHAVLQAIASHPQRDDLASHAVVAAPCQSGRLAAARTLTQLSAGGAVTVSPHIVPQCSLHSVAGAVSVALGMHGPHLGVGGGPDALAEGLFAATTLVAGGGDPACTAAWLVATEWDEEPTLDARGEAEADPVCRALAVMLEPLGTPDGGGEDLPPLSLSVRTPRFAVHGEPVHETGLVAFAQALEMCAEGGALAAWTVTCPWGAEIRVSGRSRPVPARLREAA